MDNLYDKVVKLTAEILNKSWESEPGKVTPFSSGSSINANQISDNHLEHYVQKDPITPLEGAIANIFNSNLFTNGGDKMTEKTLDVDSSTTPKEQYNNPGSSTTEPDPQSEIAITKMDRPKDSQDETGKGTYSTTANTTTEAPAAGDTTEPTTKADGKCADCGKDNADCTCKMEKAAKCSECGKDKADCSCMEKASSCPDCGKEMNMCMCKRAKCPHCGQAMPAEMQKAEDDKDKEDDGDDDDKMEKKEFSTERREQLADQKKAMPDGSYPIESEQDLKNAIRAWGRGGAKPEVKAHIKRRAKELGKESLIPENWKSEWVGFFSPEIKRGF